MENYTILFAGLFLGILIALSAAYYFKNLQSANTPERLPYLPQSNLLTPAELNFYQILLHSVRELNCQILCKVRVADLLKVEKSLLPSGESWQKYFNKIQAKHIDFVICNAQMQPKLFVELDDSSHQKKRRQERDDFLNQAFRDAGLRLVRIKAQKSYNTEKLAAGIMKALD